MKKRLKLKKAGYIVIAAIIVLTIATIFGIKKYQEYKYHQTYEYKLLQKGYTLEETNKLQKLFNNKRLDYILKIDKNDDLLSFASEKYYIDKYLEKYLDYKKEHKDLEYKDIISIINTYRDNNYYEIEIPANLKDNTTYLVNKYFKLNKEYLANDLINISSNYAWGENNSKQLREVAFNAYIEMYNAAKIDNINLMINSAYRTYEEQELVYNNYKDKYGEEYADQYAARPGNSEHQTGLAIDIFSKENTNTKTFKDSEAYYWLKDNSWKYGFILRYPEDKENITGFSFEAWHYRYVGKDIAKYIYDNNIAFDEYYAYFIENKK